MPDELEQINTTPHDPAGHDEDTVVRPPTGYAGFWLRFGAFVIDLIIINIAGVVLGLLISIFLFFVGTSQSPPNALLSGIGFVLGWLLGWLYWAKLESSNKQATFGKQAFGVKVTDLQGNRLSFGHASWRWVAKALSLMTLGVGFFMAAFTQRKQALHDILVGCLVVNVKSNPESGSP